MTTTEVKTYKAKKKHQCDWCGELIQINETYNTWFWYEERTSSKMHKECYKALQKAELEDYFHWILGEFIAFLLSDTSITIEQAEEIYSKIDYTKPEFQIIGEMMDAWCVVKNNESEE